MEELELTVKPSQWMNFAWILFAFVGVFIHPILGGIIAVIYFWKRLEFSCWSFEIYKSTICEKKGVLISSREEIHFFRIKSISVEQNTWEKLIGVYTYIIRTADPNRPIFTICSVLVKDNIFRGMMKDKIIYMREKMGVRNMDVFERY
jgi:membrane protein YdbS with pleckstrin-like domain